MKGKPGRPKKVAKKVDEPIVEPVFAQEEVAEQPTPVPEPKRPEIRKYVDRPSLSQADHIAESRKALDHPLAPGQKFFEAPDGEIIVGEADKSAVWSRRMNDGKGGWINPRR